MWMDEEEISKAMYRKCKRNDQEKYWSLITDPQWSYFYCMGVKNRPEVRKNITDPQWSDMYCKYIGDRAEAMYKKCLIDDKENFWVLITEPRWAYMYCKHINDRPSVRAYINDSEWSDMYCKHINDRPEIRKYCK